jgi:hypothetical protein
MTRQVKVACAGIVALALSACGRSGGGAGDAPASSDQLSQLGFYTVAGSQTKYAVFKEYGSGDTNRSLPASDFPALPVLTSKDHFLLFGPLPEQPMGMTLEILPYELVGDNYKHRGEDLSLATFFAQIPSDPFRGQQVLKLQPNQTVKPGTYFLHKYVGVNGDAYLGFRIAP